MRTPLIFFSFLFFSTRLFSQQLPVLTDSDMVSQSDFGKKIGWCKVKLDASFNRTNDEKLVKYECYLFSAGKDLYSQHYFKEKNRDHLGYHASGNNPDPKLLDGSVDYFDKSGHIIYRLVFKQGFLVKEYDCRQWLRKHRQPGRVRDVIENVPQSKQVEYFASTFDQNENIKAWGHGFFSGKTFDMSPPYRSLSPLMDVGQGWIRDTRETWDFFIGFDSTSHNGKNCLTMRSLEKKREGVGRTYQDIDAEKYRGKRVRMSGYIRSDILLGHAEFFLQVWKDGVKEPVAVDVMRYKRVGGKTEWTKYELVLDVPDIASYIRLGAQLEGTGQVWFDDITFEIVDNSVPLTSDKNKVNVEELPKEPVNLDFEK